MTSKSSSRVIASRVVNFFSFFALPRVHIYQQKGSLFKVCNGSTQALRNQMQYQFMNSMIREMNIVVIVGGDTWVHNKSVAFLFSGYFKDSDKKGENSNYSTTRSSSKIFRVGYEYPRVLVGAWFSNIYFVKLFMPKTEFKMVNSSQHLTRSLLYNIF